MPVTSAIDLGAVTDLSGGQGVGKRPETVYKKGDMVIAKRPNTKQLPTKYRKHAELEQFFTAEIERVACLCDHD